MYKIITDRTILKQPSEQVVPTDKYKEIIAALKEVVASKPTAIGLSAPQIGIKKCISYIRIPSKINMVTKKLEYIEKVLINPVIVEKEKIIQLKGEGCCSFPGIKLNTDRYIFITVDYLDENLKPQTYLAQDLEGFTIQHEVDHLRGLLLFDRKHKAR